MYEMVYPSTSGSEWVSCASAAEERRKKIQSENCRRGNESQMEGYITGERFQIARGLDQHNEQINGQIFLA